MIVDEKSCSEGKMRQESFGTIAIDGEIVFESTRNLINSLENSTVGEESENLTNEEKFKTKKSCIARKTSKKPPKIQCKYKRQLCRITRILRILNRQVSSGNKYILKTNRSNKNYKSNNNHKVIYHMILAELQHMGRQQLMFLCMEKQFGIRRENHCFDNGRKNDRKCISDERQKQLMIYQSSSDNSEDFVVAVYEDKLSKYRRYIELLNLEHSEEIQKYDIKFEQRVRDLELFFQARENDMFFDYDLKIKEIMLEHKQKISAIENKFKRKVNEEINMYAKKLDSNQKKYMDIIQHFKSEIKHREQHVIVLTRKFSTLLELKDKFLLYYNSTIGPENLKHPLPSSLLKIKYIECERPKKGIRLLPKPNENHKSSLIELEHVRQVLQQFLSIPDLKIKEQLLVIISNMLDYFVQYMPTKK